MTTATAVRGCRWYFLWQMGLDLSFVENLIWWKAEKALLSTGEKSTVLKFTCLVLVVFLPSSCSAINVFFWKQTPFRALRKWTKHSITGPTWIKSSKQLNDASGNKNRHTMVHLDIMKERYWNWRKIKSREVTTKDYWNFEAAIFACILNYTSEGSVIFTDCLSQKKNNNHNNNWKSAVGLNAVTQLWHQSYITYLQ